MAQEEEMSALFPIFALSLIALLSIPWTIYRLVNYFTSARSKPLHCQCSLCSRDPKNRPSLTARIRLFLSWENIFLIAMWVTMALLLFYIQSLSVENKPFEPFSILGLPLDATDVDVKKAYRKLSLQYHPDKNPDPDAHKFFIEHIQKAYHALTDEVARKNWQDYGHPDGQQSMNVGIALPKFMLDIKGTRGAYLLIGLVGVGILLPLVIIVIYLSQSSKYTGNHIMHATLGNFYHLMKPALAPSKVIDVLTKAAEFLEMKVRGSDVEPLQQVFGLVRGELNLDPKNLKQETLKFWRRLPSLVKVELLLLAQLVREGLSVPRELRKDFNFILQLVPRLLDELMKMALYPRPPDGHGWLRPATGVMELSQCFYQAVPLSARKAGDGVAGLMQLPHLSDTLIKKMARRKVKSLQELRDLPVAERKDLLTSFVGLSEREYDDIEATLACMPEIIAEVNCSTQGEADGIQEGDVVTLTVWLSVRRTNGLTVALPHCPLYPFPKDEAYWVLLADTNSNAAWVSQRVTFLDEQAAIQAATDYARETAEGEGLGDEKVNARVKEAVERVKGGARMVICKFQAPEEAVYSLTTFVFCDCWIGCDKKLPLKMKIGKRTRSSVRAAVAATSPPEGVDASEADEADEEEDEDSEEEGGKGEGGDDEDDDDDYLSEYSEDADEEVVESEEEKEEGGEEDGDEDEEEEEGESDPLVKKKQ